MPPTPQSWKRISLILNGVRFTKWADESPPVEFPDIDNYEEEFSPDGGMHVLETNRKGGPMIVKLQSDSPQVGDLLRWDARVKNGEQLEFNGTYEDPSTNHSTLIRGGFLKTVRPASVPGETFSATFICEELIPNADRFTGSQRPV